MKDNNKKWKWLTGVSLAIAGVSTTGIIVESSLSKSGVIHWNQNKDNSNKNETFAIQVATFSSMENGDLKLKIGFNKVLDNDFKIYSNTDKDENGKRKSDFRIHSDKFNGTYPLDNAMESTEVLEGGKKGDNFVVVSSVLFSYFDYTQAGTITIRYKDTQPVQIKFDDTTKPSLENVGVYSLQNSLGLITINGTHLPIYTDKDLDKVSIDNLLDNSKIKSLGTGENKMYIYLDTDISKNIKTGESIDLTIKVQLNGETFVSQVKVNGTLNA